jgi:hypothetical protein
LKALKAARHAAADKDMDGVLSFEEFAAMHEVKDLREQGQARPKPETLNLKR